MTTVVERIRRHSLPAAELQAAVNTLIVLLDASDNALPVFITAAQGQASQAVELPASVREVILDAVSLLAARNRVALVAVDDTRKVKLREVAELLDVNAPDLFRLVRKRGLPGRTDHDGHSYSVAEMLELFRKSRDEI